MTDFKLLRYVTGEIKDNRHNFEAGFISEDKA
jgi:hypothetical protein